MLPSELAIVPELGGVTVSVRTRLGSSSKVTPTVRAAVITRSQVAVVESAQSPVQAVNCFPTDAVAVNVTAVPLGYDVVHVVGQLICGGDLVSVIDPPSGAVTVSATSGRSLTWIRVSVVVDRPSVLVTVTLTRYGPVRAAAQVWVVAGPATSAVDPSPKSHRVRVTVPLDTVTLNATESPTVALAGPFAVADRGPGPALVVVIDVTGALVVVCEDSVVPDVVVAVVGSDVDVSDAAVSDAADEDDSDDTGEVDDSALMLIGAIGSPVRGLYLGTPLAVHFPSAPSRRTPARSELRSL